jgi:glycosyltransferase involved in cell wall biosynthesis
MSTASQTPQRILIAFATGWGSEFGGINVFNSEFLQHFAFATQGHVKVVCVVPAANADKIERAHEQGVMLVPLPYTPAELKLDASHAPPVVEKLIEFGLLNGEQELVWLGHDRITGAVALEAKTLAGGRVAMIHHMSYTHYEAYAESALSAYEKSGAQRALFEKAEVLFAIGPLLRDALEDLLPGREITTLTPGLDELLVRPAPKTFTGFMSGRLSADAAKIKQSHLGVAAFANAHKRAYADAGLPDALKNQPRLILRGADMENASPLVGQPDATDWRRFAEAYADRVVNVQALSYTTERSALLDELSRASVALMPSWHEGFGLTGWEAVAAGVPLIVSVNSGLHQLLREHRNGAWLNWVFPVDIRGKVDEPYFHEEDLKAVSDRLLEIAKGPSAAREKALSLREGAFSDFAWRNCVDAALKGLRWLKAEYGTRPLFAPTTPSVAETGILIAQFKGSPLELPSPQWQLGSRLADSQLLRAEEAAVPFHLAREPQVSELIHWAYDARYPQALRLITGAGGTGKTRLAIEVCSRLSNDGWHCGFLPSEISDLQVAGAWNLLSKFESPLLVVFDYAETRQETLLAFVRIMLQADVQPRLRLLLLARDGGEWWDRLPSRNAVCEPFLSGHATSGPFTLPPLHGSIDEREAAYQGAVIAYASRLKLADLPQISVDLTGEHFDRPLYVQMAALLALRGERRASAEGLTKALLYHERRYWARVTQQLGGASGLSEVDEAYAAELMTLATLAGGFARVKDAQHLWKMWGDSGGSQLDGSRQRTVFERLAALYPGQRGLQPLRPDLLGEALVASALLQQTGSELLDALLGSHSHSVERRNALTVLARLSMHRPDIEGPVVHSLIRNFLATAVDLLAVATQSDSRLPEWAERAFICLPLPVRHQAAGMLIRHMQKDSVQLAQFASVVSGVLVEKNRSKWQKKPADKSALGEYALSLSMHSDFLARVNRDPVALTHARESVRIFEQLVEKSANAFNTELRLAHALTSYSMRLTESGDDDEARSISYRALQWYEKLASHDTSLEPDLANALNNYGIDMAAVGNLSQALIYNERGLQLFAKLAANNAHEYEPKYAWALYLYAKRLTATGRYSEALTYSERAVQLFENAVNRNPDRYKIRLGQCLSTHSSILIDCGEYKQAVAPARRAAEIAIELSLRQPLVYAEEAHFRSLQVTWLEWLNQPSGSRFEMAEPSGLQVLPHRLPVLQLYHTWVRACYLDHKAERGDAMSSILSISEQFSAAQLIEVLGIWSCAWAWCMQHTPNPEARPGAGVEQLSRWTAFLEQRGWCLPAWMDEVARRMHFPWPAVQ